MKLQPLTRCAALATLIAARGAASRTAESDLEKDGLSRVPDLLENVTAVFANLPLPPFLRRGSPAESESSSLEGFSIQLPAVDETFNVGKYSVRLVGDDSEINADEIVATVRKYAARAASYVMQSVSEWGILGLDNEGSDEGSDALSMDVEDDDGSSSDSRSVPLSSIGRQMAAAD